MFQQALSRSIRAEERVVMQNLIAQQAAIAKKRPPEEVTVGNQTIPAEQAHELATWTAVARVILNLHEVITRS